MKSVSLKSYFGLLENLSPEMKLALIELLSSDVKKNLNSQNKPVKTAFGAWKSEESAEEIVESLRSSRNFSRNLESL